MQDYQCAHKVLWAWKTSIDLVNIKHFFFFFPDLIQHFLNKKPLCKEILWQYCSIPQWSKDQDASVGKSNLPEGFS